MPPVVAKPSLYAATYNFNWLATPGTGCLFAAFLGAIAAGLKPRQFAPKNRLAAAFGRRV